MSPPPPRILMTADAIGGVWTFATALAKALAARGCHINLITLGPRPTPAQRRQLAGVADVELTTTDLQLEWMDPHGHDLGRARRELAALALRHRPDLVHLNGYREALLPWGAPALVVAHSCVHSWWRACRGSEPDAPEWATYGAAVAAGLAAAAEWVAPSASFRDTVAALYQPPRPGLVIHNGIQAPAQMCRKQPIVLGAGRCWDEAKNLQALAAVAAELPWPVVIAGAQTSGDAGGEKRAQSGNLTFTGRLPHAEMLRLLHRAAVFVSPARYEPFGLGVLEAAGAGCALVLSDIPTFRELWDGAALFVAQHDAHALQRALQRVCTDEPLRISLQRRARARASTYGIDIMADRYCDAYASLLAREPQASRAAQPRPYAKAAR